MLLQSEGHGHVQINCTQNVLLNLLPEKAWSKMLYFTQGECKKKKKKSHQHLLSSWWPMSNAAIVLRYGFVFSPSFFWLNVRRFNLQGIPIYCVQTIDFFFSRMGLVLLLSSHAIWTGCNHPLGCSSRIRSKCHLLVPKRSVCLCSFWLGRTSSVEWTIGMLNTDASPFDPNASLFWRESLAVFDFPTPAVIGRSRPTSWFSYSESSPVRWMRSLTSRELP